MMKTSKVLFANTVKSGQRQATKQEEHGLLNHLIPFVSKLKANISSRFGSQDVIISAFSIFDPKKTPKADFSEYTNYGKDSLSVLLNQYGSPKTAIALDGEEFQKLVLITDIVHAEWTTFRHYIGKEPKEDMLSQLNNILTKFNDMLKTMFPNLHTLANVCMTLPVGTASVERSFS